jgi:hypothetical protein
MIVESCYGNNQNKGQEHELKCRRKQSEYQILVKFNGMTKIMYLVCRPNVWDVAVTAAREAKKEWTGQPTLIFLGNKRAVS